MSVVKRHPADLAPASAIRAAARVAHEVNRAYCATLGDMSQAPWAEAAEWQRVSAISGVLNVLQNPDMSPGDTHRNWLKDKEADGWILGPVKDPAKKEHPCMVPFEDLPPDQQAKDHLFLAAVKAILWPEGSPE